MANDDFNQLSINFSNFDCFDESHSQVDQEKLERLKNLRKCVKWEIKEQRYVFLSFFRDLSISWRVGLPDLREIFSRTEIDQLLTWAVLGGVIACVRFVIRTGYKDEPDLDKDGKPLTRRTTPVNHTCYSLTRNTPKDKWDIVIHHVFKIYNRLDVNYTNESGLSHFHVACISGYLYGVKQLFKVVQDPNFPVQETGDSPLHLALRYGKKKVAEWLLKRGAEPNFVNAEGLTPLHMICVGDNDDDLAEMLFEFSNDKHKPIHIDARDNLGNTPLHLALKGGRDKVTEWLLKKGANPNFANAEGLTPLHIICQRDKDNDLLEKFFETNNDLQQTVQIDALDKLGRTPLQWAVARRVPSRCRARPHSAEHALRPGWHSQAGPSRRRRPRLLLLLPTQPRILVLLINALPFFQGSWQRIQLSTDRERERVYKFPRRSMEKESQFIVVKIEILCYGASRNYLGYYNNKSLIAGASCAIVLDRWYTRKSTASISGPARARRFQYARGTLDLESGTCTASRAQYRIELFELLRKHRGYRVRMLWMIRMQLCGIQYTDPRSMQHRCASKCLHLRHIYVVLILERWEQEAKAAEDLDKMRKIEKEDFGDDLALSIINKNKARAAESNNFFDSLINKYAKAAEKPKKKTNTRTTRSSSLAITYNFPIALKTIRLLRSYYYRTN
ncbi:unnamed protein product [Trichogramma brassicae]|uniref:Uncharacterized protein n=1 Tax=Trichogramma brassicae TaxID=86971 RepID=A0A6H5ING2_9HYME|nr:unnamed protein product [Trichogramma brassicae]